MDVEYMRMREPETAADIRRKTWRSVRTILILLIAIGLIGAAMFCLLLGVEIAEFQREWNAARALKSNSSTDCYRIGRYYSFKVCALD